MHKNVSLDQQMIYPLIERLFGFVYFHRKAWNRPSLKRQCGVTLSLANVYVYEKKMLVCKNRYHITILKSKSKSNSAKHKTSRENGYVNDVRLKTPEESSV